MIGRPPKPTALKVLRGNPGRHPLNKDEPKPALGAQPPSYVLADPVLLAEWHRHAPRLTKLGLLSEIDDGALGVLCVLEVRLRDTLAATDEAPLLSVGAILDLSKELRQLWSRFGMTPADRARVKVEKSAPDSTLSRFTKSG